MEVTTFYIYHIPGLKYGCTQNYPARPASQSDIYELAEVHTDIMVASEREKELNIAANYPWNDSQYYWRVMQMSSIGAKSQLKSGTHNWQNSNKITKHLHTKEMQTHASKIANASPTHVNKQKSKCPHCLKIGNYIAMRRWHFDKCKLNNK